MKIELRQLSLNDGKDIYQLLLSFKDVENGFYNPGYGITFGEFQEFLKKNLNFSKGIGLTNGHVPQTIYWLIIDGIPVGIGKLRHCLNDALLKSGGHIGYGISPKYRGRGYGRILLRELKKKAKAMGIKRVLLTCNKNNMSSRKVIEYNNGILESDEIDCRYWIQL